jgi:hypothetical protein
MAIYIWKSGLQKKPNSYDKKYQLASERTMVIAKP